MANNKNQGEAVRAAYAAKNAHIKASSERRARDINEAGQFLPMISEEIWDEIIYRLEAGQLDSHIMSDLGFHQSTLVAKRRADPEFAKRYRDALEEAYVTLAREIKHVTRGEEGYSSGSIERDRLIAEYDYKLAKAFAGKIINETQKIDVTVSQPVVMLEPISNLPTLDESEFIDASFDAVEDDESEDGE